MKGSKGILILLTAIGSLGLLSTTISKSLTSPEVCSFSPTPPFSGGPGTGGLGDRTGSPISSGTCAACHSGGSFGASTVVELINGSGNVVTSYTSGQLYTIRTTVSGSSSGFGSQTVALTATNANAGSMSSPSANAQLVTISGRDYFEHDNGPSATGVFEVTWSAPTIGTGTVNIYGIGLAVNENGGTSGDQSTATAVASITEDLPTTISYPGTPFCANDANQTPVQTGETGGVFSSVAGLDIDGATGLINVLNSTAGTYNVDYVYSQGTVSFNVTINPIFTVSDVATICSNETLVFGSQTLDQSNAGINTEVFQSINGCDSTVNLTLTVNSIITTTQSATICNDETFAFGTQTLDQSDAGLNTEIFQTVEGCDSTVELTLTVQPAIDDQISPAGNSLVAAQVGATYQWLDCDNGNANVVGATSQSFIPTNPGNYAAEITSGNCTVTSPCLFLDPFVGIEELNALELYIFPLPVDGVIHVKGIEILNDVNSVAVVSLSGKVLKRFDVSSTAFDVSEFNNGIYFLVIEHGQNEQESLKFTISN